MTKLFTPLKSAGFIVLLSLMLFSCSKKVRFVTSTVVPAAEGHISIDRDENKNYKVDIEVIRLADPSRLNPPRKVYVAWLETKESGVKNIGQIKSVEGFFTNSLKANLSTVSPYKPKRVFVSAEDEASVQTPGSQIVLTTESF